MMGILEGVVFIRVEDMAIIDTVLGPMQGDAYFHRDIKTFENYAFVVSENTGTNEGMQIIDLSSLPDSVLLTSTYIYNDHIRSHNMSIDVSTGFAYVLGQNREGVRIIDINNSEDPQEIHYIFTEQIHDVFARNDTVYIAEGWRGTFSMYDVSQKTSPALIVRVDIPDNGYVHTIWPSDDGKYVMTTEETATKTVKFWNVEDLENIHVVGEYLGPNLVAHNAQVMGSRLFISNYTYGMSIVDFSDPVDPIESAHFDTYTDNDDLSPPWAGNWGIYQYTENDFVFGSDINGLFTVMKYYKGLDNGAFYGDVNEDQIIDNMDIILIVNMILYNLDLTESQHTLADLNFDDIINIFDIYLLAELINNN
jgi:choice-of-anchor B domain-containing protein